jgi:hypothetical protein
MAKTSDVVKFLKTKYKVVPQPLRHLRTIEVICADLVYAEFVSGKKPYRRYPELKISL